MHQAVLNYVEQILGKSKLSGKSVIEVGSYDFNGTVRPIFLAREPEEYIGVDMLEGPGVDMVCAAEELLDRFGENRFDIVVTTEMMEHVHRWREAVHHLKGVLKPGGILILTTRSPGAAYHGYPYDFWRYEIEDMQKIFADFKNVEVLSDPSRPGVFVTGYKPESYVEANLDDIALYSILTRRRTVKVPTIIERIIVAWIGFKGAYSRFIVKARMFIWSRLPLSLRKFLKRSLFDRQKAA